MPSMAPTVLRPLQFLLTFIALALSCALVSQQHSNGSPSRINYTVFTCIFGMLSLFYLLASLFMSTLAHPLLEAIIQAVNAAFFLAAAIAVSHQLGVHSCGNRAYLLGNGITNGGGYRNMEQRCREAQAMTAFLWFAFAAWTAGAVVDYLRSRKTAGSSRVTSGTRGMSQV